MNNYALTVIIKKLYHAVNVTHSEALSQLTTDTERATVTQVLTRWQRTDQKLKAIAGNIEREVNLEDTTHISLLRDLANGWIADPSDAQATFDTYRRVCAGLRLRGPEIWGSPVSIAGRATPLDSFCRYTAKRLASSGSTALTQAQLEAALRNLAQLFVAGDSSAPTRARDLLDNCAAGGVGTLSGHPTWCTFVNPSRDINPFVPPLDCAQGITNALGLDPAYENKELLVLVYRVEMHDHLHKPTVADAGEHPYFTPSPPTDEHGWTTPHDRNEAGGDARPEAVHEALRIEQPVEEILVAVP